MLQAINPYFKSQYQAPIEPLGQLIRVINETRPRTPVKDPEKMLLGRDPELVRQFFLNNDATKGSELRELLEAAALDDKDPTKKERVADEYGDVLWSILNWGIKSNINIHEALRKVRIKTLARLNTVVKFANESNIQLSPTMDLSQWKELWNKAKEYLSTRKAEWGDIAKNRIVTV